MFTIDRNFIRAHAITDIKARGGTELQAEKLCMLPAQSFPANVVVHVSGLSKIDEKKRNILWVHDMPDDLPYLREKSFVNAVETFVFVSHWQKYLFINAFNLPQEKCLVIPNCIESIEPDENKWGRKQRPTRIVYSSTPQRGLDIVYEWFSTRGWHDAVLEVYSSFDLYAQPERDKPFLQLFDRLKADPHVNYHSARSNAEVRQALAGSHVWVLPSIWPETFCIARAEAVSAQCITVHNDFAALDGLDAYVKYHTGNNREEELNKFTQAMEIAFEDITMPDTALLNSMKRVNDAEFSTSRFWVSWSRLLSG